MAKKTLDNARFLADRFDIPAHKAADLLADTPAEAAALTEQLLSAAHHADVLKGKPVPQPAPDLAEDNDEERLKAVLRTPNKRVGAG